jgi:hypothetical protein
MKLKVKHTKLTTYLIVIVIQSQIDTELDQISNYDHILIGLFSWTPM